MIDISIIIPVYNGEEYLEECLESVLKQTVKRKQIICVDDGSTDRTLSILECFREKYDCIEVLQQQNQGSGIARNNALKVARGKYVAFMDSDDFYIDCTALEKMIECCENNDVAICGSFRSAYRGGVFSEIELYRNDLKEHEKSHIFKYSDIQCDYHYQSYILRRSLLVEKDIYFPDLRRYQDPPFFAKAMFYAERFAVVPIEMYCYRRRLVPMKFSFKQINDLLEGITEQIQFANKYNLSTLYSNNVKRLNDDFFSVICKSIREGNLGALQTLINIGEIININNMAVPELKILSWIKGILGNNSCEGEWKYRFPFEKIPYNSKVVLYGAGVVGKTMYNIIHKTRYCEIVMWVDSNYRLYNCSKIVAPDTIQQEKCEYIIIAVEKESVFDEIKKHIEDNNWNIGKIIIGPIEKN